MRGVHEGRTVREGNGRRSHRSAGERTRHLSIITDPWGRGHFSTVKSPGTAAPSRAKNREIRKGGSEAREMGTGGSREKPVNKGLRTIK